MSDEESETDEEGEKCIVKRPLPWEGSKLKGIKIKLDKMHTKKLTFYQKNSRLISTEGLPKRQVDIPEYLPVEFIKTGYQPGQHRTDQ